MWKVGNTCCFTEVLQYTPKRKNSWSSDDISSMTKLWLNLRYEPYQMRAIISLAHFHILGLTVLLFPNFWRKVGLQDYTVACLSILCPFFFSFVPLPPISNPLAKFNQIWQEGTSLKEIKVPRSFVKNRRWGSSDLHKIMLSLGGKKQANHKHYMFRW